MESSTIKGLLKDIYQRLVDNYGLQLWWPANGPFEVMVGAILTQSVAWTNAEKAIASLKAAKALSPQRIRNISATELGRIIYPCRYYNSKKLKLKALTDWLGSQYNDNIDALSSVELGTLRQQLLTVYGIGPETSDTILLYALNRSTFIVDTYTRRITYRVGLTPKKNEYDAYQRLYINNLEADVGLFKEYHALLVRLAKDTCRKKPLCRGCCLNDICYFSMEGFF
ncbi:MAG: endonuclease [Dehalococcoidia bacterium]|nr:MAG: endonuclease [Dehalococcoidia bacterium]